MPNGQEAGVGPTGGLDVVTATNETRVVLLVAPLLLTELSPVKGRT